MNILLFSRWALSLLLASAVASAAVTKPPEQPTAKTPYIILKLDDLTWPSPAWKRTFEFLEERNVKFTAGIICNSLEGDRTPYYNWIKEQQDTGLVEFWNHGYDHKQWDEEGKTLQEFKDSTYEHQKEHFTRSQELAKEKLGITLHSFGAPFNGYDEATYQVLNEDPDVKVFMYGKPDQADAVPNIMILDRTWMNIENPLFVPNPELLAKHYEKLAPDHDYFVIQGHPNNWDEARFEKFKELVDYLIAQGVTFTTPYEYYQMQQKDVASKESSSS